MGKLDRSGVTNGSTVEGEAVSPVSSAGSSSWDSASVDGQDSFEPEPLEYLLLDFPRVLPDGFSEQLKAWIEDHAGRMRRLRSRRQLLRQSELTGGAAPPSADPDAYGYTPRAGAAAPAPEPLEYLLINYLHDLPPGFVCKLTSYVEAHEVATQQLAQSNRDLAQILRDKRALGAAEELFVDAVERASSAEKYCRELAAEVRRKCTCCASLGGAHRTAEERLEATEARLHEAWARLDAAALAAMDMPTPRGHSASRAQLVALENGLELAKAMHLEATSASRLLTRERDLLRVAAREARARASWLARQRRGRQSLGTM